MKKCPFCAEEIQDEAVKCRFCGEFLDKIHKPRVKWYFSTPVVVAVLLVIGPLGLPLVWLNPNYKIVTKIAVTILVIALTVLFTYVIASTYNSLMEQIEELGVY